MVKLSQTTFICLDCETTGLDTNKDRIVEIAVVRFTLSEILEQFETLINPECPISQESHAIHHISLEMLKNKPTIETTLPHLLEFIGRDTIVGHGIEFDLDLLVNAAKRMNSPCSIKARPFIDTLRLARLYGDSPNNSLQSLAKHFNIPHEGAHRAMNDVLMNVEVFKRLVHSFQNLEQIHSVLANPIRMKYMPLGKHKGRPFSEIPLQYLEWASRMDFDQDLHYSIRLELKKRRKGGQFSQAANPFSEL